MHKPEGGGSPEQHRDTYAAFRASQGWLRGFLRSLRGLGGTATDRLLVGLAEELSLLAEQELSDSRGSGHISGLFVGLLGGLHELASKGSRRMEDDPQMAGRFYAHVRELGLLAGSQQLAVARWQRWMEEHALLQGLATGHLGDLRVVLPPGEVDHLRRPLLHMALFGTLSQLVWSPEHAGGGRISVRTQQGDIIHHAVLPLDGRMPLRTVATRVRELEQALLLAAEEHTMRMQADNGLLELTLKVRP